MHGLDRVVDTQLLRPLGVVLAPHQVARRAGGDDRIRTGLLHQLDVALHDLGEEVPAAGDEHRRAATVLLFPEVHEVHARLVQQAHRGLPDVVLHVARRAAGEVDVLGLAARRVRGLQVCGYQSMRSLR